MRIAVHIASVNLIILLMAGIAYPQGTLDNISVSQRTDGSGTVDIYYSLSGNAAAYNINLEVRFGGSSYVSIPSNYLSGHVSGVSPGSNRHIVWDGMGSFPNQYRAQTRLKITAIAGGGDSGTFTDTRDGQTYKWVKIGDQLWMAENLNYNVAGSWCYDNQASNCSIYGRFYNWTTAMAGLASSNSNPSGIQGACPPGWHLPSDTEWTQLTDWLAVNGHSGTEGTALKVTSEHSPHWNGTDKYGFSALPGGYLWSGMFLHMGGNGAWWSATDSQAWAWSRQLATKSFGVSRFSASQDNGFSVRCLKD